MLRELIARDGLHAVAIAGYSLGGNLALKLAGELGAAAPPELKAVCARLAGDRARARACGRSSGGRI